MSPLYKGNWIEVSVKFNTCLDSQQNISIAFSLVHLIILPFFSSQKILGLKGALQNRITIRVDGNFQFVPHRKPQVVKSAFEAVKILTIFARLIVG